MELPTSHLVVTFGRSIWMIGLGLGNQWRFRIAGGVVLSAVYGVMIHGQVWIGRYKWTVCYRGQHNISDDCAALTSVQTSTDLIDRVMNSTILQVL